MRIDAKVAEADVGQVRAKQRVTFTVPAYPATNFEAEIGEIGLEGQREAGSVLYPLLLHAKNPEGLLRPGMSARLSIQVATADNVLTVRDAALRFSPDAKAEPPSEPRLWVSKDGVKAKSLEVSVGLTDGIFTEVRPRSGALHAGDTVVIGKIVHSEDGSGGPGISLKSRPP
jgi:HlyD family secretion protein